MATRFAISSPVHTHRDDKSRLAHKNAPQSILTRYRALGLRSTKKGAQSPFCASPA